MFKFKIKAKSNIIENIKFVEENKPTITYSTKETRLPGSNMTADQIIDKYNDEYNIMGGFIDQILASGSGIIRDFEKITTAALTRTKFNEDTVESIAEFMQDLIAGAAFMYYEDSSKTSWQDVNRKESGDRLVDSGTTKGAFLNTYKINFR